MAPDEWPIAAAPEGDSGQVARFAGRRRVSAARLDFALTAEDRLSDQERALMTAMLADLLTSIQVELAASLPTGSAGANDEDGLRLVDSLRRAGLLDDESLVSLLLRRSDEERILVAVRDRPGEVSPCLQTLIADSNDAVAACAMALVIARGRRRDRLGQPRLAFDDLSAGLARSLSASVAACMRLHWPDLSSVDDADQRLDQAITRLCESHEPFRSLDSTVGALVRALHEGDGLGDDLLRRFGDCGDLAMLGYGLSSRANLPVEMIFDRLSDVDGAGFAFCLRAANVERSTAAHLLAGIGAWMGIEDPVVQLDGFDHWSGERIEEHCNRLRLDPAYRRALDALGGERRNG